MILMMGIVVPRQHEREIEVAEPKESAGGSLVIVAGVAELISEQTGLGPAGTGTA